MPAKKPRRRSRKKVVKLKRKRNPLNNEIISIILVAVGILAAIAVFIPNGGGALGLYIKQIFVGLFGMGAIFMPFVISGLGVFYMFKRKFPDIYKSVFFMLLFICIISFAFMLSGDSNVYAGTFFSYISYFYKNGSLKNGGMLGAMFGNGLAVVLGNAGAYIVLTTGIVILIMVLSGKSFVNFLTGAGRKIGDFTNSGNWDEDYEYEEEEYEEVRPKPAPKRAKKPMSKEPDIKHASAKPHLFTINNEPPLKKEKIDLIAENEDKPKGMTFLKDLKSKNITDITDLSDGDDVADFDLNGEQEEVCEFNEGYSGFEPPEEVYVETKANKKEKLDSESKQNDFDNIGLEIKEYTINRNANKEKLKTPVFMSDSGDYEPPPIEFLKENPTSNLSGSRAQILENSRKLEDTLKSFGVEAKVVEVSKGPTVTRYELAPGVGVKVSKISGLADDLALNLAATGIRIEAPIPGKAAVGIEVPNKEVTPVYLREVLDDDTFINFPSKLAFGLGKDIAGNTVVGDIAKMPHLLIAGATGSGKSVCVNTLITSIIYKANPDEVKLLMVDPKVVELSIYNGIPHLLIPVVTDPKKAAGALNWAVTEMITRYNLFAETSVRDLKGYNEHIKEKGEGGLLPQIVIIIDELADLMMAAPGEVEDAICRLAQMARAAGLHLIIATQRPSVDVITGLIKANIPSRLAFSVSSGTDSRTVLDMTGAEKLLGKGDMLFFPVGMGKPLRVQGAFISDKEVESIVSFVKRGEEKEYDQEMIDKITATKVISEAKDEEEDEFFEPAVDFLVQKEKASASLLQRQFRIGYNRASRLIEVLEAKGIVGPEDGSKPRKVLLTPMEWAQIKARKNSEQ